MKVPAIKKLVENYDLPDLQLAENAVINEQEPEIPVDGEDDGEKLTHILAAIWIINEMNDKELSFREAMRAYSQRVRKSVN